MADEVAIDEPMDDALKSKEIVKNTVEMSNEMDIAESAVEMNTAAADDEDEDEEARLNESRFENERSASAKAELNGEKNMQSYSRKPIPRITVDREKICPFLIRVFVRVGGHNEIDEYSGFRVPLGEICLYTWKDATLKELALLIQSKVPAARRQGGCKMSFRIVYQIPSTGAFSMRDMGLVKLFSSSYPVVSDHKQKEDGDLKNNKVEERHYAPEERQINSTRFEIGDFLDVAIIAPNQIIPRLRDSRRPLVGK